MAIPLNTDLTPGNKTPGIYVQEQIGGAGSGDPSEQYTVLLLGEMLSGGAWAPSGVYDVTSEQDIIDGADGTFSDSGSATTGCSTIRRQYRAVVSQVGEGNVRVKACPVTASGTAATYTITVHVVDSSLAATSNPTTGGTLQLQVAGEPFSVTFTTSDTNAAIAGYLRTELAKSKTLPVSIGSVSTASITLTYNVGGILGEDLPLRANVTPGSGVYVGVGTLTVANTAAGSTGSIALYMGTQTCSTTLTSGDTAPVAAAAVKAALLLDDFPLIGGAISTATFPLLMRNGRDVRRISANVITSTTTTLQISGGSATSGIPDATRTYNGTVGAGLPTLTTALANIDNAGSFGEWTCPWNTAGTSSTGLIAIATAIEAAANGAGDNKNQHLTIGSVASETTAAAIAASVTGVPLGSSLRYTVGHCPDAGQQVYELAARRAAQFAAWTTPATNSDAAFGGTPFRTRSGVPLNLPALRIRQTRAQLNAALVDGLEPWCVVDGALKILRGRCASTSTEEELWDPSFIRQYDMMRRRIRSDGYATFVQPKVKADGILNQQGEISADSVRAWAIGEIHQFELEGFYDGAAELKSAVKAQINQSNRSRIDIAVPASPVIMVHQFGIVLARSAPSLPAQG